METEIKCKIRIEKIANFFFFLANLSKWKHWCRQEYNEEWIKMTGKLMPNEQNQLKQFCQVMRRTSQKKLLLYDLFFQLTSEDRIWQDTKKKLNRLDYNIVKETFEIFSNRFNKIWNNLPVKIAANDFEQYINNFPYLNLILHDLKTFYSKKLNVKEIIILIILLPSGLQSGGGRYDLKNNIVILEGSLSRLLCSRTVEIFCHELIHLYFEKHYLENLLNRYFDDCQDKKQQIKEAIAGSLLPNGYLSQKYFQKLPKFSDNLPYIQKISFKLIPAIKNYFDQNKKIDENLIKITEKELSG